MISVIEPFRW